MASVKLEVGREYVTRDRRYVKISPESGDVHFYADAEFGDFADQVWNKDGSVWMMQEGEEGQEIIAEVPHMPTTTVRTVTRKELVPGLYGNVYVEKYEGQLGASMEFTAEPAVIRAAIATLTEIADALEDNQ